MRTLLTAVRDHMEHEIRGNLPELMATLSAEPIYHFWNPAGSFTLRGREAVSGFYSNMIAGGGNQFEVVVEKIVADRGSVITEGQVKQVQTGKALLAAGRSDRWTSTWSPMDSATCELLPQTTLVLRPFTSMGMHVDDNPNPVPHAILQYSATAPAGISSVTWQFRCR